MELNGDAPVPPESPESYYSVARRLARDIPGAFSPGQYWNPANPAAHEATTGPEIWDQTGGRITHLVASAGTGGTISGASHFLRRHRADLVVIGADPEGSVLSGDVARSYLTEGIGEDFFPTTFDPGVVDRWVRVSDRDAFAMARRITREEGILAGESCGTAMVAALHVAAELTDEGRSDAVIVVILPDGGRSYLSKLYDDGWMREHGLLATPGASVRVGDVLRGLHGRADLPALVVARTSDLVGDVIGTLQVHGISQAPVSEDPEGTAVASLVGSISEKGLLDRVFRDQAVVERTIGEVMEPPLPLIDATATVDEAVAALVDRVPALIAVANGEPAGIVTRTDLLEHIAQRPRSASAR